MSVKRSVTTPLGNDCPVNPLRVYASRHQMLAQRQNGADPRAFARRAPRPLFARLGELCAGVAADLGGARRIGRQPRLREPQRERERDQPLLRAVVQVALEPAALGRLGLDDARSRTPELLLLAPSLRDVDAVDEPPLLAGLVDDRRARPGDEPPLAGRGDPAVF